MATKRLRRGRYPGDTQLASTVAQLWRTDLGETLTFKRVLLGVRIVSSRIFSPDSHSLKTETVFLNLFQLPLGYKA